MLFERGVDYASNAKKSELLRLYEDLNTTDGKVHKPKDELKPKLKRKSKKAAKAEALLEEIATKENIKAEAKMEEAQSESEIISVSEGEAPVKPEPKKKKELGRKRKEKKEKVTLDEEVSVLDNKKPVVKSPLPAESEESTPEQSSSSRVKDLTMLGNGTRKRKIVLQDGPETRTEETKSPKKGNLFFGDDDTSPVATPRLKKLRGSTPSTPQVKTPLVSDPDRTLSGTKRRSRATTPAAAKTKINTPLLDRIRTPEKIPTPRLQKLPVGSSKETSPAASKHDTTIASEDSADDFDNSLANLKSQKSTKSTTNAELATLLGVDLDGVRPKIKSKRDITPRRPIRIQQKLLSPSMAEEILADAILDSGVKRAAQGSGKQTGADFEDLDDEEDVKQEVEDSKPGLADEDDEADARPVSLNIFRKIFMSLIWITLMAGLLFAYWYKEQTLLVGYCGHEIYTPTVPDTPDTSKVLLDLGTYLDLNFRPQCVPCPAHARCFPRLELACYEDFVKTAPWYFDYFPVNPEAQRCVPDTKKAEKIEIMINVALDLLRARNANTNCGRADADDESAGISLAELHDLLLTLKAPYISNEEFEDLWLRLAEELVKEPEIIVRQVTVSSLDLLTPQFPQSHHADPAVHDNSTVAETYQPHTVLRSTALSHVSFNCLMSNTALTLAVRFRGVLVALLVVSVSLVVGYRRYTQSRLLTQKVDLIYHEVLAKLQRQAKLAQNSSELPEYIGSIQLRDLILSSENNLSHKMRLWEAVSRKVDRNSNVKHELLEIHGEVMKVWQWISILED